jgi:hypothetical protein
MSARYPAWLLLLLAAGAAACSTPGAYRDDAVNVALLETLRECLVDITVSSDSKDVISPCVGRDVSSLKGITRSRLTEALGPPRLCLSQTDINFPDKRVCPSASNPVWSFYRHAGSIDVGGGPELVCVANKETRCAKVEWQRTK